MDIHNIIYITPTCSYLATIIVIVGFADGSLSLALFADSGGQCEDGLKMILDIGEPQLES